MELKRPEASGWERATAHLGEGVPMPEVAGVERAAQSEALREFKREDIEGARRGTRGKGEALILSDALAVRAAEPYATDYRLPDGFAKVLGVLILAAEAGIRLPTQGALAEVAGVSRALVGRALGDDRFQAALSACGGGIISAASIGVATALADRAMAGEKDIVVPIGRTLGFVASEPIAAVQINVDAREQEIRSEFADWMDDAEG